MKKSDYNKFIKNLIVEESPLVAQCWRSKQASIIIHQFIKSAQKTVRILSERLDGEIFASPALAKAVCDAANRGVVFTIVIQDQNPNGDDREFMDVIKRHGIQLKTVCENANPRDLHINFCIVDEKRFLLEEDKASHHGHLSANNPDIISGWVERFDAVIWNGATNVGLPSTPGPRMEGDYGIETRRMAPNENLSPEIKPQGAR
ncbi:hypothetical protein M2447_002030 [Ereboglobus sp. PH5-10]|uniref:phospholipase D-like domain-containing protein n=1 Tax=Ereboglobus sp. PH5-10 TaxID=2940629 RepID=UPI002406B214|nr:phospholipase D-like domain-containing protein [Ereboglobus sp. PH5-10]MDF9827925.1 hypothetical protein [Ereboglobus sp. PH5-10]